MLKRVLAQDGVVAVVRFRDNGTVEEGVGELTPEIMNRFAQFGVRYTHMMQGNADQLAMFTPQPGWTPIQGWFVRSQWFTVCSVGNVVCLMQNDAGTFSDVFRELTEVAHL